MLSLTLTYVNRLECVFRMRYPKTESHNKKNPNLSPQKNKRNKKTFFITALSGNVNIKISLNNVKLLTVKKWMLLHTYIHTLTYTVSTNVHNTYTHENDFSKNSGTLLERQKTLITKHLRKTRFQNNVNVNGGDSKCDAIKHK